MTKPLTNAPITRREVRAKFVGKTIASIDNSSMNVLRLSFTDGTCIAIEAEVFGYYNLPGLLACETCAKVPS